MTSAGRFGTVNTAKKRPIAVADVAYPRRFRIRHGGAGGVPALIAKAVLAEFKREKALLFRLYRLSAAMPAGQPATHGPPGRHDGAP